MATAALRGGSGTASSTLSWVGYRGLANSTAIPDGANEDVNGNNPVLITRIRAWVRGKDASRSIRFEIGNFDTSFFTVTSGTAATLSSYQTINAYYANGGNQTFRIKTSALNAYIYYGHSAASNFNIVAINSNDSTATTLQTNRGINGDFEYFSVPTAPTSLARTEGAEGTFVDLSWSAPASNGGSAITGYRVQYSLSSNFSSPETVNTNSSGLSYRLFGLIANRTYFIRVAALNAVTTAGNTSSKYSGSVIKRAKPSNPSISGPSRSGLVFSYSGSSAIGDGSISSYEVSRRTSSNGGTTFGEWFVIATVNTTALNQGYSSNFTGAPATSYQIRVRALSNQSLYGDYTTSAVFHAPNVPLIPTNPIVLTKNVKKVNIDWDAFRTNANAVTAYNGAAISGYQVDSQYSSDGGVTFTTYTNITTTASGTTVFLTNDLLVAKTYRFRVRANSDVGFSAYQTSPTIFVSAYGSRATGPTSFVPIENAKIFLGIGQPGADAAGWKIIENVKRFTGTVWTDLQT